MSQLFDRYWKKWTLACAAGELFGIGIAAAIAVAVNQWMGEPETTGQKFQTLFFMLFAGAIEGFVLGSFQWRVLREKFPAMPARQWVGYTVAVAMLGWLMGMIPPLFFMGQNAQTGVENPEPALIIVIVGAMALGLIFGAIFGMVQWLVFQRYAKESVQWVTGNSLGWGLAMIWIFLAATLPDETTPVWLIIAGGVLSGILAGLSVGAITGIYLKKIIAEN